MKIKTGDKVRIKKGKEAGKEGVVLQVFLQQQKVVVENIHMATRHLKKRNSNQAGQKVQFPAPISISNVQLISPKTTKSGRVGYKIIDQQGVLKKIRVIRSKGKEEDVE